MAGPYNYLSPMQPIKEAFSLSELTQARQFNENQRVAMQKEELQKHMLSEYEAINKNDINQIQSFINKNPGMSRQGQDLIKNIEENEKRNMKYTGIKAMLASRSGNVPLAISTLEKASEGYKNSDRQGDEQKAQLFDSAIESIKYDPENATKNLNLLGGSVFGKDWWESMESQTKIASTEAGTEKTKSEAKQILHNIGIDQAKLKLLPTGTQTKIGTLTDSIAASEKQSALVSDLISDAGATVDESGYISTIGSKWQTFWGNRDQLTQFRTRMSRVINKEMLDGLPPGSASEKDVAIVRAGFPPIDAKADEIKSYLESAYRIANAEAKYNEHRIEFLSENFSEGKAKKDFTVGGKSVNKGETFSGFMKRTKGDLKTNISSKTPTGQIGSGDNKPTEAGSAFMLKYNLIK